MWKSASRFFNANVNVTVVLPVAVVYTTVAVARIGCTTLDSKADRAVCKHHAGGRNWLDSVEKIAADTDAPDLASGAGRLFIFDSQNTDGSRAVYQFSSTVTLPGDIALVGNDGNGAGPLLLLGASNQSSRMETTPGGHYLLADLEIRTQSSGDTDHNVLLSSGPEQLELAGVTLSANYSPASGSGETWLFNLLSLSGDSSQKNSTSAFDIHDCDLRLPNPGGHEAIYLTAVAVSTSPELEGAGDDIARVTFTNNRIFASVPDNPSQKVAAVAVAGNVEIASGSTCNEVVNAEGVDLLNDNAGDFFDAQAVSSGSHGVIGFTNQYAWGWRHEQGQLQVLYDTWDNWQSRGSDAVCKSTGGSSSLLVKVIVPVVVVVGLVAAGVAIFFGGRKVRRSINAGKLRSAVQDSVESLISNSSRGSLGSNDAVHGSIENIQFMLPGSDQ